MFSEDEDDDEDESAAFHPLLMRIPRAAHAANRFTVA
jgi:hypothetical protein